MGEGYEQRDDEFDELVPVPDAQDRIWRHPAERGADQAAANLAARRSQGRTWPAMLMSFVAGCCAIGLLWILVDNNQQTPIEEVVVNEITPTEVEFEGALSFDAWVDDVSQMNRSSVVALHLAGEGLTSEAQAILLRDDGHLLTSAHAISAASEITVEYAGGTLPAQIVGSDPVSGIAVLKINSPNLPPPTFGDDGQVLVRDRLVALTYSDDATESAVAVDLVGEDHVATSVNGTPLANLFALGENLAHDWAGSAVLSEDGGIVAMTVHSIDGGNYAIPITLARRVANQLIDGGQVDHKAWLGVETSAALTDDLKEERGIRGGLLLTRVWDETPAARAGLVAGDIITRAGSINVLDRTDFLEALATVQPGDTLEITYSRIDPGVPISTTVADDVESVDEIELHKTTVLLGARAS